MAFGSCAQPETFFPIVWRLSIGSIMGKRSEEDPMRKPEPSSANDDCGKVRLAKRILDAVRRAEDLGIDDAARLLRQAQVAAKQAAEAGRTGSMN